MPTVKEGWRGRFYEDFAVGDLFRCRYGRTITEYDNISFSLLSNNSNQVHFNDDYARRTEWGRCLVNSLLTLAVVTGMSTEDVSENGFALGWQGIELPHPVFAGDTLYSESEVLSNRESKSRPTQGIIEVETRGFNQNAVLVLRFRRTVMVWKRDHAPSVDLPTLLRPTESTGPVGSGRPGGDEGRR